MPLSRLDCPLEPEDSQYGEYRTEYVGSHFLGNPRWAKLRNMIKQSNPDPYKDFTNRLKLLISKNPDLIITTLSNIFTMRLLGNKTHGDLAEIAIAEFINQYMYDFRSVHVGKDLYRAKTQEEDIKVINEITKSEFPVSLKAYGDGPLQLSTDKSFRMFPKLEKEETTILNEAAAQRVLAEPPFSEFRDVNILPLIYNETRKRCNILLFDYNKALKSTVRITREEGGRRKHPIYRFSDAAGDYVCEVRYGNATANALQRGLWTHTKRGFKYFNSLTNGWIGYSHNMVLIRMFSHALVSSEKGHVSALRELKKDLKRLKRNLAI